MDINNSFQTLRIIFSNIVKVSEIVNEDQRQNKLRDKQSLNFVILKSYRIDSEINSIYPTSEIRDNEMNLFSLKIYEDKEKMKRRGYAITFKDPKIGRNINIEK